MVNGIDYAILGCLISSALFGVIRGFVKETLSLATWATGLTLSSVYYEPVSQHLNFIALHNLRLCSAFLLILFVVLVVGGLLHYALGHLIKLSGLKTPDRIAGLLFGSLRGALLVAAMFLVVESPMFSHFKHEPMWQESRMIPPFELMSHWLQERMPEELLRKVKF